MEKKLRFSWFQFPSGDERTSGSGGIDKFDNLAVNSIKTSGSFISSAAVVLVKWQKALKENPLAQVFHLQSVN